MTLIEFAITEVLRPYEIILPVGRLLSLLIVFCLSLYFSYNYSGMRSLLRNKSYEATVSYLPSQILQSDHHPGMTGGSRCYSG